MCLIAEDEAGVVLGFAGLSMQDPAALRALYVHPEVIGSGDGTTADDFI